MRATRTTDIDLIVCAFSRARDAMSPQAPLAQVWDTALNTNGDSTLLLRAFAELSDCFDRTISQIKGCDMSISEQTLIISSLKSIRPLFHIMNMYRSSEEFKDTLVGSLAAVSMGRYPLLMENPQAAVSGSTAGDLSDRIHELIKELQDADIPNDIKSALVQHATFMAYALANANFMGIEAIYAALGAGMFAVRRLPDDELEEGKGTGPTLKARFAKIFRNVAEFVDTADRSVKTYRGIQGVVHDIGTLLPGGST